ncbi:DUF4910 domain-containing protein [Pontimonas sp.]|nr:DUF4910 domain-containing protein [Pontimonas sp.]
MGYEGHFSANESYLFDESICDGFGQEMFEIAQRLWPLNRSLTGDGNRATLQILESVVNGFKMFEMESGSKVFDWSVPEEWGIRQAWILTPDGQKICDFAENNLHVVGYSAAIDTELELEDLLPHIHSLPDQPTAIPYVTSYYKRTWGFCASEDLKKSLGPGKYRVFIDSEHFNGTMSYGEVLIPGREETEVLLSTYICHPSMANNELSGIVLAQQLARWIQGIPDRRHTYRIVFVPETVGAIAYISRNLHQLKASVVAGYVLTCVGDERAFSFLPSRKGDSLADTIGVAALGSLASDFLHYSWQDRESDERQYGAPGVDLPVASVMRSKYGTYPEYHTSLDKLGSVVTSNGLAGSFLAYMRIIQMLELDSKPRVTTLCEPQLGKRGLYPDIGIKGNYEDLIVINELIGNSDGQTTLIEMMNSLGVSFREIRSGFNLLAAEGLLD